MSYLDDDGFRRAAGKASPPVHITTRCPTEMRRRAAGISKTTGGGHLSWQVTSASSMRNGLAGTVRYTGPESTLHKGCVMAWSFRGATEASNAAAQLRGGGPLRIAACTMVLLPARALFHRHRPQLLFFADGRIIALSRSLSTCVAGDAVAARICRLHGRRF